MIGSRARFVCLMAGRKFGKTKLAVFKSIQEAGKKGSLVWYIAPTYKQAKDIAWGEFMRLIPTMLIETSNKNECLIELKNGSIIQLRGTDYEKTLRGAGVNFMVLDEAADLAPHLWEELLRPNLAATQGGAWFIGTPRGRNWFWKLHKQAQSEPDWESFNFTSKDNPHLEATEIARMESMMSPRTYRQEILAEADETTGIVFEELNPQKQVIPPIEKPTPPIFRGIDWGLHDPTCALWAVIRDKKIIIFDEHYQAGLSVPNQATLIKAKSKNMEIEWTVIDPKAFARDPTNFNSVALEFSKQDVECTRGDNRVDYGISIIKRCFQEDAIRITSNCKNLIKELLKLEWKNTLNQTEQYVRTDDHATDCLRYLLVKLYSSGLISQQETKEQVIKRLYPRLEHPLSEMDDFSGLYEGTV